MSNSDIRVVVSESNPIGVQMEYTTNYNKLTSKPSINGVELVGNKTTQDLHIETGTENWELINTADFSETAVDTVEFTVDSENKPFELKNYKLIIELLESNGNRWHLKTTGMSSQNFFYMNSTAQSLYKNGRQVIVEPLYSYDKILNIKYTVPPPNIMYGQSQVPQLLQYYTYNNAVETAKSDLFPIKGFRIELQNAVTGKIYLYGVRNG